MEKKPNILFITGASGVGKTMLLKSIKHILNQPDISYFHFDSIEVPSQTEMIIKYGSGRNWQKKMTHFWINKAINDNKNQSLAIIEGQVDLQIIVAVFEELLFQQYEIILIHASKNIRNKRLNEERNQAYLASEEMEEWAAHLRQQANHLNKYVIDTTNNDIEKNTLLIIKYLKNLKYLK
ncbi:MAG: hypothetical protein K0R14_2172 [Burkholderiales bacterium]|jgi:dephospho-CoA kinase|nr:hypothetical protein [Burkholderiales bacterium]